MACSKDEKNPDSTPTPSVSGEVSENNNPSSDTGRNESESIPLGGSFARDNTGLSFYIADSSWNVAGYYFPEDETTAPVILSGAVTVGDALDFLYSDENNEITFTFAAKSVTVAVTKGTSYKVFEGSYPRMNQTVQQPEILSPEKNSATELLGRIALTHYMLKVAGIPECTIDLAGTTFDQDYMEKFLLAYADLFLTSEAEFNPEISTQNLVCAVAKEDINNLLLTSTAGAFDASKLNTSAGTIVLKDNVFYIPCLGAYAGGLTIDTNSQEDSSGALTLGGVVSKSDGTRYDIKMTLVTAKNSASGAIGIQITSVDYKLQ